MRLPVDIDIETARKINRMADRAERLLDEGYTITEGETGIYTVAKPDGTAYTVDTTNPFEASCTCKSFQQYGACKHYMAVEKYASDKRAADEAQAAYYDANIRDTDDDRYPEL